MINRLCRSVAHTTVRCAVTGTRHFSSSLAHREIRSIRELPDRVFATFDETKTHELLALHWPTPPRNVLITKKERSPEITSSLTELAKHISSTYPSIGLILESEVAAELHEQLPFPVYTIQDENVADYAEKVDLVATLGGDGTILHASALFATCQNVPPVLSFSMGTLGFLGEWRFDEYKRAFREVYMSGAGVRYGSNLFDELPANETQQAQSKQDISQDLPPEWASLRGKSMGQGRSARILLRNRLKCQIRSADGAPTSPAPTYAMNEVIIHRGLSPHLAVVDVLIGGKFLTSAVADGMIVSTPTGSTAYSLSSGGSIVHPLVSSLLLTPICPRSLSFRPLVLPAHVPISLRLSTHNRAKEIDVSIDGIRQNHGLQQGMEVHVWGEGVRDRDGVWRGGVPSVVRGNRDGTEDHWVGGLNGLLKFNYPFGQA
ncbi:ATP-NAD kinase family protein [Microthyrium microscopicum]|uniref:ATP-NAD kinase family protein n=1 Tax=Microthyrium microscopicum TaxID=703497 RepID=A0A6A6UCZ9_9PEZI|nr:ATP-NAD kinase family protein [Microthyrium microscopicum]